MLLAVAVGLGYLFGGRLRGFENLEVNRWGLALVGLALQLVPAHWIAGAQASVVGPVMLALSYPFLIAFLAANRWIPGTAAMSIGLFMNLVVVVLNGGMPIQASAIERAGMDVTALTESSTKHHLMSDGDVLRPLGDVLPVPPPGAAVFSIGDALLYGGVVYSVVQIMRGRRRENPRPLAWWFPEYRGKHAPEHWRMPVRYRDPDHAATGRSGTEP